MLLAAALFVVLDLCNIFAGLDPAVYRSPGGEYLLCVDPERRDGMGPSRCALERNGSTVWIQRLPFSPCRAAVTDAGQVVAVAHECRETDVAVVLDASGAELAAHRSQAYLPRCVGPALTAPPRGIALAPDRETAAVRIFDGRWNADPHQFWRWLDLRTGECLGDWRSGDAEVAPPPAWTEVAPGHTARDELRLAFGGRPKSAPLLSLAEVESSPIDDVPEKRADAAKQCRSGSGKWRFSLSGPIELHRGGATPVRIERAPNGCWTTFVWDVAEDGAGHLAASVEGTLALYTTDGRPLWQSIPPDCGIPLRWLSANGGRVLAHGHTGPRALLLDLETRAWSELLVPGVAEGESVSMELAADGRELLVETTAAAGCRRFRLQVD